MLFALKKIGSEKLDQNRILINEFLSDFEEITDYSSVNDRMNNTFTNITSEYLGKTIDRSN